MTVSGSDTTRPDPSYDNESYPRGTSHQEPPILHSPPRRKLRLPIFSNTSKYKCKRGAILDPYGDHSCLGCKANHKTKSSNGIRNEIIKIFNRILPFVGMIDLATQLECETHNIVPSLPRLQPFDLSIQLDHSLDLGSKFRKNSGQNSGSGPFSGIFGSGFAGIIF
jgi:hypothetical protein